jgi:crossover junction endodeoxyribonuclease RuvC
MGNPKIILGIDPGYGIIGFGVIRIVGSKVSCLTYGSIETEAKEEFSQRLMILHSELKTLISKYKPHLIGVEELFFSKNTKTAIKVAQARGVILLTAKLAQIPIVEYTPNQVKQAISAYGKADKKQVQKMVKILLGLDKIPYPDDAADALAIAICAASCSSLR